MFVTNDNQKITIHLCYLKTVLCCFNKCKWVFYGGEKKNRSERRRKLVGGEEWRLTGKPAGQKVDFPHLPHLLFMWDRPPRCLPTQHLVSLFCIKVGRVTWLLLLKSAVGRSTGRLTSTWGGRAVVAGKKTVAWKRILEKDTDMQLKSVLKSTSKPLWKKHVCFLS